MVNELGQRGPLLVFPLQRRLAGGGTQLGLQLLHEMLKDHLAPRFESGDVRGRGLPIGVVAVNSASQLRIGGQRLFQRRQTAMSSACVRIGRRGRNQGEETRHSTVPIPATCRNVNN